MKIWSGFIESFARVPISRKDLVRSNDDSLEQNCCFLAYGSPNEQLKAGCGTSTNRDTALQKETLTKY